jgi:hypothetical protein
MVIWAETQEKARRFAESARLGTGGVIFAGNRSARSLRGLKPTAILEVDGARHLPGGAEVRLTLNAGVQRAPRQVPWLQLGQLVVEA